MKNLTRFTVTIQWVLFCVAAVAPCFAQQYHLHPPNEAIPETLFGLHIHRLSTTTAWPDIPFGSLRLWDANVTWWNLEPGRKGNLEFQNLDKQVDAALSHHVEVFMNIGMTPTWASARPADSAKFRPGAVAEPKNMQDWQDFVKAIATRYKGKIRYWEVWNEPNDAAFYTGNIPKLVDIAKVAYETLKQVDPSNMVTSPPATYGPKGVPWVDSYLRAGGGQYADIIGFHFYSNQPEDIVPLAEQLHAVMNKDGAGSKPLWNTETGWGVHDKLTPLQGEGYVARAYILAWASGISRFYWYDWDSNTMGLSEKDGTGRIPAGYAYVEVQRWLVGAHMSGCDSNGNTWTCEITRDGGYHGYIVWNSQTSQNFNVPAAWKVTFQRDIDSHEHDMKGVNTAQIGIRPILLTNMPTK
jgi:Glycosyl hydrolases family 39